MPCQTWCFKPLAAGTLSGYMFGGGLPQQGPHLDYTSGVSVMLTSHPLPGICWGEQRGATAFWGGAAQQRCCTRCGNSLLPMLAGLCLPPAERNVRVSARVFLFPQFNELMTPKGDAAVVMGTFCGGTCSFWRCVGKYGCAYGVSDTFAFSCCAPLGQKKPQGVLW